jgi:hypothetical protein
VIVRTIGAFVAATALIGASGMMPASAAHTAHAAGAAKPPKAWDPRVRQFAKYVEKDRRLAFEHPVAVAFLDDAAFVKALNAGDDPTKADRRQAEHHAAQLRAVGMIGPDVDLIDAWGGIDDTTTTGFYDPDTKKLYVRGHDLTDTDVRLTVVHELTHALQDQHFDLGRLDDRVHDSGASFAEDALIEGDATRVENDYFFTLPQREQDAYNDSFDAGADEPTAVPDDAAAPGADAPVLDAFDSAPYDYGSQFVTFVIDDRGPEAVDALFHDLPRSEEQIIDPVAAHRLEKPLTVAAPKLTAGEKAVGAPDVWGAYSLYLMLAARIDRVRALEAADDWGGDAYRAFTSADGTECVRVALKGDGDRDTREIGAALGEWAAQMPVGGVATTSDEATATFTACDVGGVTSPDAQRITDAGDLLYDRNHFAQRLVDEGLPYLTARCAGAKLGLDEQVVAIEWADRSTTADEALYETRRDAALRGCSR